MPWCIGATVAFRRISGRQVAQVPTRVPVSGDPAGMSDGVPGFMLTEQLAHLHAARQGVVTVPSQSTTSQVWSLSVRSQSTAPVPRANAAVA